MSKIIDKLRQLKYRLKHDFFAPENIVLVLAVIMCLTWTYQSIEAMNRNWTLTERLNTENMNLELLKIEVETAELENEYYKTEEYQELAARKLANKQLEGEHKVSVPANSEAAKNKHKKTEPETTQATKEYSNFEKWMQYLLPQT